MNYLKKQRERFTSAESWSPPPHAAYHPLRVSRSVTQSSLHSLDNSRFSNERRSVSAAGGFFSLDSDDNDYLLEDSQVPMDSTVQCLCKCGLKKSEASYPRRSRSFLGYLPGVEEEMSMPFPRVLHGSSTAPLDEKLCYAYGRPDSTLQFIFSNPSSLGLETSGGVPYFSTNIDGDFQRPSLEEDILVNSLSRCTLGQTRHRDQRRMLLRSTPEKFRCINQVSSDIYNSGMSLDPMNTFRNLHYEGIQSPGYEVQFRKRQGASVPSIIRPKQALSSSPSEVPSSSSVSVSSDETEHPGEHPQLKVGLYKTELCRSWEETGFCRYGAKCQVCQ